MIFLSLFFLMGGFGFIGAAVVLGFEATIRHIYFTPPDKLMPFIPLLFIFLAGMCFVASGYLSPG